MKASSIPAAKNALRLPPAASSPRPPA
jgi:hypothetical protein